MCGFAGFLDPDAGLDSGALARRAEAMAARIRHRGPDDAATFVDARFGVAVGFRRLSVRDLGPSGRQPMESAGRRYVLAFNGEVYGAERLRARLEGEGNAPAWRGTSDTEVLLAAIEAWGLPTALDRTDGMFALALWDRERARLALARDRMGEKPLYVATLGRRVLFGSETAALRAHPAFPAVVDRDALRLYFRYGWIPGPRSIHHGVSTVPPGTWVEVSGDDPARSARGTYWSLADVVRRGVASRARVPAEEAAGRVGAALSSSVRDRVVADVPVGLLLSGGVDSTAVAAAARAAGVGLRAFTAGFDDPALDESRHAADVARALGLEHRVLRVGADEALEAVPRLLAAADEPFADPSRVPTALVCALAREHVTVVLTGDGGDELFGGYPRHVLALRPAWALRQRTADALGDPRVRLGSLVGLRGPSTAARVHRNALAVWRRGESPVLGSGRDDAAGAPVEPPVAYRLDLVERLLLLDQATYLPDDLLVKIDRASMAVGLEARAPFLSRELVELAWRLPRETKVVPGRTKVVLRRFLDRALPGGHGDRPKQGFAPPLDAWLRGPLRAWADALLDPSRLREEGYLDAARVGATWRRLRDGGEPLGNRVYAVLAFEAWLERVRGDAALGREPAPAAAGTDRGLE
jgi:asparagine synthase (glutamine-hydrolysing)